MVCPKCKCTIANSSDYCIFCGKTFTRNGRRAARYCADGPKRRRPSDKRAQRFLGAAALIAAAFVFGSIWFAPAERFTDTSMSVQTNPSPEQPAAAAPTPELTSAPTATPVPSVTPAATPAAAGEPFADFSGVYTVDLYLFEATGGDAQTQANLDELLGKELECVITLDVDGAGDGTVLVEQSFFDPETIPVSAVEDVNGAVSESALFGVAQQSEYRVAVSCLRLNGSLSGFIWLDSAAVHMEFMFFG